ncbi:M24 family metallopeptidase [Dongia sedimenti]|uniref:Xaa-Pro peptidase family protein n=1 Tax=Dongia sedimenti TaxID=3064282 RepID=A0ABU0YQX1_9PROT|nr:Xaa-Pro peptidase family protein [Rhodospirillaceae bacterium R-7]
MALHFSREELAARRAASISAMQKRGLDGLLMFRQESMYYLTGYDTFGYVYFQCLYLGADGRVMLLTRAPDLRQAQHTSDIRDIRIWVDGPEASPAIELKEILHGFGLSGKKLGVEWEAYGLTARNGMRLASAFDGFARLIDASDLVSRQRLVKSPAEIAYVRKAAELADLALDEAHRLAGPGVSEAEILAAMQSVIIRNDGDDPANEFIIGSGDDALLCRYKTGRRVLEAQDQLTLEFAGVFRHYHSCLMRTIPIGKPPAQQVEMHKVAVDALEACKAALKPGRPIGDVFDAHAKVLDAAGYSRHRMNATGYSLGAVYAPNWMDWPMFYHGNPEPAAPGQVYFIHLIIFDSEAGLAMTSGQTVLVTEGAAEVLSKRSTELVIR